MLSEKEVNMSLHRRDFIKKAGFGMAGLGLGVKHLCCSSSPQAVRSESLLTKDPDHPEQATYDRLPLNWHKKTVSRLKEKIGESSIDGILLQNRPASSEAVDPASGGS